MEKKVWTAPALEVLDVSMTMAGTGTTSVDYTYVNGKLVDIDIYDGPGPKLPPDFPLGS
jgi:hypothetical protein